MLENASNGKDQFDTIQEFPFKYQQDFLILQYSHRI